MIKVVEKSQGDKYFDMEGVHPLMAWSARELLFPHAFSLVVFPSSKFNGKRVCGDKLARSSMESEWTPIYTYGAKRFTEKCEILYLFVLSYGKKNHAVHIPITNNPTPIHQVTAMLNWCSCNAPCQQDHHTKVWSHNSRVK
jgi:hypothetical protein